MLNKRKKTQYPVIKHDLIEDDPITQIYLELAGDEAHAELVAEGWVRGFGYGPVFEMVKKRILKTKYQIDWKTLQEINSGWTFLADGVMCRPPMFLPTRLHRATYLEETSALERRTVWIGSR